MMKSMGHHLMTSIMICPWERMKFEKAVDGSWVCPIDDVIDDEEDIKRDMADVGLNTPTLHTYNEETYALTFGDETSFVSQFE